VSTYCQVRRGPVHEGYAAAEGCTRPADMVFHVTCENGHQVTRPACRYHRDGIRQARPGDVFVCRECAEAGHDNVPVAWTEATL